MTTAVMTLEHPATRLARWRLTIVAISVAVAALPLLRPSGPGNTGMVDLALVGALLVAGMWASIRSHILRLPYALPVGLTVLAGALVVTAIVLTLSNGGMLALVLATACGALFRIARRRGLFVAVAVGVALALAGIGATRVIDVHGWVTRVEASSPFVRDSLGRESESGGSRSTLIKEASAVWLRGDSVLGLGPGNTEATLRDRQAAYVKEAHNDYVAALLERGVLGATALVLLAATLAVRARRISVAGGIAPEFREVVPRPELLAAAVIAV